MREALRVLRDLYSARHYCRSCTNFFPSPFSRLFPPLLPFFFVSSAPPLPPSSFSFYYFPLSQHSSTQDYYVTGTMAANEDCGGTIADSVSSEISEWFI